ncbi:MAG: glycosyltransferase family 4 protein [Planctomycetes bacterium]|nr:glycosyltransferase family 4 protein [Planctomycetota bacterium]
MPATPKETNDDRPGFGIVSNVATPYRIHLQRRVVAEIPQLKLYSFFTHGRADFNWEVRDAEAINPIWLGDERYYEYEAGRPRNWVREYRKAGRIIDTVRRRRIAAVLVNGYRDLTRVRLIRWCRAHGIHVFMRGDSNIRGDRPRTVLHAWAKRRLLAWVIRSCDAVMPMGRLGQAYFEKYGADPGRCFWVPYEPDYDIFTTADPDAIAAFRAEHGLAASRRYLLFGGRLVPVKRVDLLIDAFVRIADRRGDWNLIIAGDGRLREELAARVPRSLADRVIWLGFLEVDAMRLAYHVADVMVLPSDYEPWALVVNEAMAAGCPVVSSDVVGAAWDMVKDRVSGRLFPAGDIDALTEALLDVTDAATGARYREATDEALADWRRRADPVEGIRQALQSVGVLPDSVTS